MSDDPKAPPCPVHDSECSPMCAGRALDPLASLRDAAAWALAYLADPEGLAHEKENIRLRLRRALGVNQ